jgi:hypothetical protein
VFVVHDDVITAVVLPVPQKPEFLAIASHEVVELAGRAREIHEGSVEPPPNSPAQLGSVLFDEYSADRLRTEIAGVLGWTESALDADPGLVSQTNDMQEAMTAMPAEGPPPTEFWTHWVNVARVWAMVVGRRDGGSETVQVELNRWSQHPLIADQGWSPVRRALADMYDTNNPIRPEVEGEAAQRIWTPIEAYGNEAWTNS